MDPKDSPETWHRWWIENPPASLADFVPENARRTPQRVIFNRRVGGTWQDVTAAQFEAEVREVP